MKTVKRLVATYSATLYYGIGIMIFSLYYIITKPATDPAELVTATVLVAAYGAYIDWTHRNDDNTGVVLCKKARKAKQRRKRRKHRVIRELESKGYYVEKEGKEWNVWPKGDSSTIAVYDRLSDINTDHPM